MAVEIEDRDDELEVSLGGKPLDVTEVVSAKPTVQPFNEKFAEQQSTMSGYIHGDAYDVAKKNAMADMRAGRAPRGLDKLRAVATQQRDRRDVVDATAILENPSLDQASKTAALAAISDKRTARGETTLKEIFADEVTKRALLNNPSDHASHMHLYDDPEAVAASDSEIHRLINEYKAGKLWDSTPELTGDFVRSALLPGFTIDLVNITQEALGRGDLSDQINPGQALNDYQEALRTGTPDQRVALVKKTLAAIDKYAGTLTDNDWEQYDYLQTLLGDINPEDARKNSDKVMTNMFAALDALPFVGKIARPLFRSVSQSSPMRVVNTAAPNDGAEIATEILRTSNTPDPTVQSPAAAPQWTPPGKFGNYGKTEGGALVRTGDPEDGTYYGLPSVGREDAVNLTDDAIQGELLPRPAELGAPPGKGADVTLEGTVIPERPALTDQRPVEVTLDGEVMPRSAELPKPGTRNVETTIEGEVVGERAALTDRSGPVEGEVMPRSRELPNGSGRNAETTIEGQLDDAVAARDVAASAPTARSDQSRLLTGRRKATPAQGKLTDKRLSTGDGEGLGLIQDTLTGLGKSGAINKRRLNKTALMHHQEMLRARRGTGGNPWSGSVGDTNARALGTEVGDIISTHILPKTHMDPVTSAPDIGVSVDDIARAVARGINLDDMEKDAALAGFKDRVAAAIATGDVSSVNKMAVSTFDEGNGFRVTQSFQKTEGYGFSSMLEARIVGEEVTAGLDDAVLEFRVKDLATGNYRRLTNDEMADEDMVGEFLVRLSSDHYFSPRDVLADTEVMLDNAVKGWGTQFLNKSSAFRTFVDFGSSVAADKSELVRSVLRNITKPFDTLKRKQQAVVLKALDKSETERRWMGQDELWDEFNGNQSMVDGYNSIRNHAKATYHLEDARLVRQLKDNNYRRLNVKSNDDTEWLIARPVGQKDHGRVGSVYDPETKTIRSVNKDQLEEMEARGYTIAESIDPFDLPGQRTSFIKVKAGEMRPLPRSGLLKEIQGYIPRRYEVSHVVTKRVVKEVNGVHGKEEFIPIRMASTINQAQRGAAKLRAADANSEYVIREAREIQDNNGLSPEYMDRTGVEYYQNFGRLTNHRGIEVDYINDEARRVFSPADAIEQQRAVLSRHIGIDSYIDTAKARWEAKYSKFSTDGKFPRRPRDLRKTGLVDDKAAFGEARAYMDHINLVSGQDLTAYRELSTKVMTSLANSVSNMRFSGDNGLVRAWNTGTENLSIGIMQGRNQNFIDHFRNIAFLRSIVFNPVRQFVLQAQSAINYIGVDYGMKYFLAGRGIADVSALSAGLVSKQMGKDPALSRTIAKATGMSVKDFDELLDGFKRSGLVDSIDSHQYAAVLALGPRNTARSGMLRRRAENLRTVARWSRQAGFDAGESINITAAFAAARNKAIQEAKKGNNFVKGYNHKLPWNAQSNLDVIGGYARSLSFNMNKAGAQRYQRGAMGVFFQFMSHVVKSAQVMTPSWMPVIGKVSDKTFNEYERMRIMLVNAATFGAGGFGLNEAYEAAAAHFGWDTTEEVDGWIKEGIAGSAFNMLIRMADDEGETSKVVFSQGMAPFSGVGTTASGTMKAINAILMNDSASVSLTSAVHGILSSAPATTTSGSTLDLIAKVSMLAGDVKLGQEENILPVVSAAGRWFPIYNNFMKGRVAQKLGNFHTQYANPTVRAAAGEILAKQLLGLQTEREVEVRNFIQDIQGDYPQVLGEDGIRTALDDEARTMYQELKQRMFAFSPEEAWNSQEMWDAVKEDREIKKMVLSDTEYQYLMNRFTHYWFNDRKLNKESKLTEHLQKGFSAGYIPADKVLLRRIERTDFADKQKVMDWLYANLDINREDLFNGE